MQENNVTTVQLSAEELREFEAFRAKKDKEELKARTRQEREHYRKMGESLVDELMPRIVELNAQMASLKQEVYSQFSSLIDMKAELFGTKSGQRSHSFMNEDSTRRIILGYHKRDMWDDTAEAGIEMVKEYISSLAGSDATSSLVAMLLDLLSKDASGNLQADKVLQLDKYAERSDSDLFREGVAIIKEAYRPERSKQYIRAEIKDASGKWCAVPLSITEVTAPPQETLHT